MPLDALESDLLDRIRALMDGSKNLSRVAAARAVPAKELDAARRAMRHALFQAAGMDVEALARSLDARMPDLPAHIQRQRRAVAAVKTFRPDRITPDLHTARNRLTRAILDVLARVEGKEPRM